MTVGIAAICTWGPSAVVVTASDRMMTFAGGMTEYEPYQTKVFQFGPRIIALIAGESPAQTEICRAAQRRMTAGGIVEVAEASAIYAEAFAEVRRTRAEREILAPLGLTLASFIQQQRSMAPELAATCQRRLTEYSLEVETVITGIDQFGAHVYTVEDPGHVLCHDGLGFAAIGNGAIHAAGYFMFRRFAPWWGYPQTLFLAYAAKKRAEAAAGVGYGTDMCIITAQGFWQYDPLFPDGTLDTIYRDDRVAAEEAARRTDDRMRAWLEAINVAGQIQDSGQAQPEESSGDSGPANDQEGLSEGTDEGQPEEYAFST